MSFRSLILAGLCAGVFSGGALAQETLHVDPARSSVEFTLPDPMHTVHGTFHVQGGEINFSNQGDTMSGTVAVDARSGDSGNSSRDKKMTQNQLKADTYSTVTFAPKSYTGTVKSQGDSDIVVSGVFTLVGKPHDIKVPMHVRVQGTDCKAAGQFVIPYVQWGVKDPSNFLLKVGKEVTIDISLSGELHQGNS